MLKDCKKIANIFFRKSQSMVEAAGIEPASEDIATKTSTSLVCIFGLASAARTDTVPISQSAIVSPL